MQAKVEELLQYSIHPMQENNYELMIKFPQGEEEPLEKIQPKVIRGFFTEFDYLRTLPESISKFIQSFRLVNAIVKNVKSAILQYFM